MANGQPVLSFIFFVPPAVSSTHSSVIRELFIRELEDFKPLIVSHLRIITYSDISDDHPGHLVMKTEYSIYFIRFLFATNLFSHI